MTTDTLRQTEATADMDLVRDYAALNSETAFASLVARHVNLVYSVALRQVRDTHLAEEITQAVFVILARKANSLGKETILSGWLCRTARYVSQNALTIQRRRQRREQEAHDMQTILNEPSANESWMQIAPLLESALAKLSAKDHDAIVLRFFEGKDLREVGVALGASEDAAKKRVSRALEKLRQFFFKRGVNSTTTTIAEQISANSIQIAPAALAKAVTATALAKGIGASSSTLTLIKGALKIMAWTKMKTAIVAGVVVLLAAGTTTITVKKIERHRADESWRVAGFNSRILDRMSAQIEILPSKLRRGGSYGSAGDKMMGTFVNAETVVQMAYGGAWYDRTILSTELPKGRYDFIASLPNGNAEALQKEIQKQFGVVGQKETIETNVLFLKVKQQNMASLKLTATHNSSMSTSRNGEYKFINQSASSIASLAEGQLDMPVIDQTGLTNNFDIDLKWSNRGNRKENFKQALTDQLGLELVPGTTPVEFLVVEKAK